MYYGANKIQNPGVENVQLRQELDLSSMVHQLLDHQSFTSRLCCWKHLALADTEYVELLVFSLHV